MGLPGCGGQVMKSAPQRQIASIIAEHSSFVWRVLLHLGVPESKLEDLSQEVFLVVIRRLDGFEERSSLRTWLYGICRNLAAAARRDRHLRAEVLSDELPESVVQPAQEGALWIKQAHARLLEALDTLDEEQRQVFVLYEIEELSMEEIAEASGAPPSTCYSRLYTAREKIRAELCRRSNRSALWRKSQAQ
jgi:RNA polymerase sigma-70 factor (ECF subfamily)